jgi:hypothetical protein
MDKIERAMLEAISQDPSASITDVINLISEEERITEVKARIVFNKLKIKKLIIVDESIDMALVSEKGSNILKN